MLEEKTPVQVAKAFKARGKVFTPAELGEFQSWRRLREQFRQWEGDTQTLMELLRVQQPALSEEELERYGNAVFQTQAIKLQDAAVFTRLAAARQRAVKEERQMELRREQLRLQREKFEFDAAAACQKHLPELRAIADDEELDLNEQIQRIRRRLFGLPPEARTTESPEEKH